MPNPLPVSLIGVTGFGKTHYEDLLRQTEKGQMRVHAATVINPAEAPERVSKLQSLGTQLFSDYNEMLAKTGRESAICFVPTGIHWHAPMAIDAMRAGSNVMIEKPAAATIQEVRAMQAVERETGKFCAVGFQNLYAPETHAFKRELLSGRLGRIRALTCTGRWPRNTVYYTRNPWAGKLKAGERWVLDSPFSNALAHWLNLMTFLSGATQRTACTLSAVTAELYRSRNIESVDSAFIKTETLEGPALYFGVTHATEHEVMPVIKVLGDKGWASWDFARGSTQPFAFSDGKGLEFEPNVPVRERMMDDLVKRVADPKTFICDLEIAAAHTLVCDGAHESSKIHDVNPAQLKTIKQKDSDVLVWQEVDGALTAFAEKEKLPAELGYAWAKVGTRFEMKGYAEFTGGKG